MAFLDLVKKRHSHRQYKPDPVPEDVLNRFLEAGRLAPSARNDQDWTFWVQKLDDTNKDAAIAAAKGQKFVGQAPLLIGIATSGKRNMTCGQPAGTINASIALSFMLLQAAEDDLGTCWLGAFLQDEMKEFFGIPADLDLVAVTPLGYPADTPDARPRKSLDEIAHFVD